MHNGQNALFTNSEGGNGVRSPQIIKSTQGQMASQAPMGQQQ